MIQNSRYENLTDAQLNKKYKEATSDDLPAIVDEKLKRLRKGYQSTYDRISKRRYISRSKGL